MQIKVKDTRMHKTSTYNNKTFGGILKEIEIPVVEAKLVLVECKKSDYGAIQFLEGVKKPILISETETIEIGDWVYHPTNGIGKADYPEHLIKGCKKILVLPEHFSPKHLQAIVDGKLKEGDKVLVECEQWYKVKDDTKWIYKGLNLKFKSVYMETYHLTPEYGRSLKLSLEGTPFKDRYESKETVIHECDLIPNAQIKLNSSNHITLHKVEEKIHSFTGKEKAMFEAVKEGLSELIGLADGFENDYVEFKKWFEQNVK